MKSRIWTNLVVFLVASSPIVYLLLIWHSVPQIVRFRLNFGDAVVKEHSRSLLLITALILAIIAMGLYFLMNNLRKIDPIVQAHTPTSNFNRVGILSLIFLVVLNYFLIITAVNSIEVSQRALLTVMAILFAVLGNYMNNIKPNFFAGLRLPWTLRDENNWRQTHHLASRLWFSGGIFLAVLVWLLSDSTLRPVFFTALSAMVLIPAVYSYRLYRRSK